MNKYVIIVIIVVLGVLAVFFLMRSKSTINSDITKVSDNLTPNPAETTTTPENINNLDNKKMTTATLRTSMGDITIKFFEDQAPKTVANFLKLAGDKFYDGVKFHRVIKGFMIQGGDPLSKDDSKMSLWGTGGPGYKFADEIDAKSDLYVKTGYKKGIVAMANSGPNTNGSQFFIMAADYPLPPLYTIFGEVVSGIDVVTKIENTPTGPNDRPVEAVVIKSITVNN